MPWLKVNHTRLCRLSAVPIPLFALDVHRGSIPGQPGAKRSEASLTARFYQVSPCGADTLVAVFEVVLDLDRISHSADCLCFQTDNLRQEPADTSVRPTQH